ncbi:MAG: porin, partial [Planctomycetaceae bacterium]
SGLGWAAGLPLALAQGVPPSPAPAGQTYEEPLPLPAELPPGGPGVSVGPPTAPLSGGTSYDHFGGYDPATVPYRDCESLSRGRGCPPGVDCDCGTGSCDFLLHFFDDPCGRNCLEDNGYYIGGWIEAGITFNPDDPRNNRNDPVRFNTRDADPMLNQLYLIFSKDAGHDPNGFGWGFQMDFLAGNDAQYTQADGFDEWGVSDRDSDFWAYAMPQLYAEVYAPIGNGLRVKAGHFYTILGYERVPAVDNFFYSHSYTFLYGEPFTHTGVLATYDLNDTWTVSAGWHNGWDDFSDDDANPGGFLGGVTYTSCDDVWSVAYAMSFSQEENDLGTFFIPALTNVSSEADRYVHSIVAQVQLTEKLKYVIQSDYGVQSRGALINPGGFALIPQTAEWYGVNNYLFYTLSKKAAVGLRYEWFHDDDGTRVPNGGDIPLPGGAVPGTLQRAAGATLIEHGDYQAIT